MNEEQMLDWIGDYGLSITVDDVGTLLEYVGPDCEQWMTRAEDLRACIRDAANGNGMRLPEVLRGR